MIKLKKLFIPICIFIYFNMTIGQTKQAIEKQIMFLSGTDNINTKTWDFYCTDGYKSGYWTKIEVPSCWEQQGFGSYDYGRNYHTYGKKYKYSNEKGLYRYEFIIPKSWKNKVIYIVFEGSMTDTEVKINEKSAGDIHQGSFYRFKYDITDKLNFEDSNLLEVTVSKMSSNKSVNYAERYADYWIFGGIFRPVYLEAYPEEYIERSAIVAMASGTFTIDIFPKNLNANRQIIVDILSSDGNIVGTCSGNINNTDSIITFKCKVNNPSLWSSETPYLYKAKILLKNGEKILYETSENFGFRTIEVREGDGIYINNKKIRMKGINRHAFWPETGRSLNKNIDLMDVKLIKEMNMNSVRCSHYPPDKSFLDICDSLGLYVLDELAGWQNAYDTLVGEKLVKEIVIRDVNHPCIIFWSNGNEGGTNKDLDDDYLKYDPSGRIVIHAHHRPGNDFNGIETNHYESYESTQKILSDSLIYMTTEFLHCQNDGGGGAGLDDYWELMRTSSKSGGGFLWALLDEGVVRTDLRNTIDVNGVNAPDGVLGPHREKEGSFYAIKEIYTPVYINLEELPGTFNGEIEVENRFDFTNLDQCKFNWKLVDFKTPLERYPCYTILHEETFKSNSIEPGEKGKIKINLPANWKTSNSLMLSVYDPFNNTVMNWSWKIKNNEFIINQFLKTESKNEIKVSEIDSSLIIEANDISFVLNKKNGYISNIKNKQSGKLSIKNGPLFCAGNTKFIGFKHFSRDSIYIIEAKYSGDMKYIKYKFYPSGWIELEYEYSLSGKFDFSGISFDYPEDFMLSVKWLGNGPYRVWKNRMKGVTYNIWENAYNNTTTGYSPWIYPEFKGYFSDVTWMEFNTVEGKFLIASKEKDLFIRLFEFYGLPGVKPHPNLPPGDISLLDLIPPIGTKMSTKINAYPKTLGPSSQSNIVDNTFKRTLYFYFGSITDLEE